jgi:uncharacterized tellurite resistance protein B-like protein
MTRNEDLARLDPGERLRLLRFVTSLAWSDLTIRAGERAYIHRLVSRLHLTPEEAVKVEGWLNAPPTEEEVDPTTIPHEHRQIFLEAVREMMEADGETSPEERETYSLLRQLTR